MRGLHCDRVARHAPVSACVALDSMLRMKEMESVCEEEGDFASHFVPLVSAACAWAGLGCSEAVKAPHFWQRDRTAGVEEPELLDDSAAVADERSPALLGPLGAARSALAALLECRGCPTVARAAEIAFSGGDVIDDLPDLCRAVSAVYEAIIRDAPQFLSRLLVRLQPQLTSALFGRRLAAVAFSAQLLDSSSDQGGVEATLKQKALANLLFSIRQEKEACNTCQRRSSETETPDNFLTEEEREEVKIVK